MTSRMRRGGVLGAAIVGVYVSVVRPRQLGWGATTEEGDATLPGDDLVPNADLSATRGINVGVVPQQVWPWIAQLGQGRGGFYSYDALENLVGCDIQSAERVVPKWQHPRVGDEVKLHPKVGLAVAVVRSGHALVLRGAVPVAEVRGKGEAPYDFSWAFVLREGPKGSTRLLVRERYQYTRWWAPALVEPVEIVSFVMTRRMLMGIKERAERDMLSNSHGR